MYNDAKSFIKITGFGLKYIPNETIRIDEVVVDYIARLTEKTELMEGLIIIGFSIFVISFLGWIGIRPDYEYFLTAYSLLIILLVTIQLGVIGIIMVEKSKVLIWAISGQGGEHLAPVQTPPPEGASNCLKVKAI